MPLLAEHLLQRTRAAGSPARILSAEAKNTLAAYSWPGNIRELRNVIERLVITSSGKATISPDEVKAVLPKSSISLPPGELSHCSLEDIERLHIQRVLDETKGNKTQAAKILDIDYKTLLAKLKKYGLPH